MAECWKLDCKMYFACLSQDEPLCNEKQDE